MNKQVLYLVLPSLLAACLVVAGCSVISNSRPSVVIASPPSNSQYRGGEQVAIQSTSTDPAGIARVDLVVDGTVVRTDLPPSPQLSFTVVQTWTATPGTHSISVNAYNTANVASGPAAITVAVAGANPVAAPTISAPASGAPTPTTASAPTATLVPPTATPVPPAPTAVPPPPPTAASAACTNNASFVADVTVPDGTFLAQGQSFNKIWRLRNTGSCTWNGYRFVFSRGLNMSGIGAIGVPFTPPGATADLLVPMAAPVQPGSFTGWWRLRTTDGTPFGAEVWVTVQVIAPALAPPPVIYVPAPSTCSGTPFISSFTVSPTTITSGQSATLSWGFVGNADEADIDNSIGGVATPGSMTVTPGGTTTYTLTAHCGAIETFARVAVGVVP